MEHDGLPKSEGSGWRDEWILWVVLVGLSLVGLSGVAVVMGFIMLFAPGLLLMAAPNLLLYGAPLRMAVWLGWAKRFRVGALIVLSYGMVMTLAPPLLINSRLESEARRIEAGDFDYLAPDQPAPRTIELDLENGAGCFDACRALLGRGLAERVVTPLAEQKDRAPGLLKAVFRLADAEACQNKSARARRADDNTPTCILRSVESDPKADILLRVVSMSDQERKVETSEARLDPFSPGRQSVEIVELWPCAETCTRKVRQAHVRQERLLAPLLLYLDLNDSGLDIHRAWARTRYGTKVDPAAVVASKWAAKRPFSGDMLPIVFDLEAAIVMPDPEADLQSVRAMIQAIGKGQGPLSEAEKTLVLWAFEGEGRALSSDLSKRPEVIALMKGRLGAILLDQAGRATPALWHAQRLIAGLPDTDYRRLQPELRVWLRRGAIAAGNNDERFLIRLSDLGPVIVDPLTQGMLYREGLNEDLSIGETQAAITALCLLGDANAAPALLRRKGEIRDPQYRASELRALSTALDRIEGRAPKQACLKLFPGVPGYGEAWVKQFAEARGLRPAP